MPQTTCITFIKYKSLTNKVWAFGMMQYAHKHFAGAKGLTFYKLMGSGKGLGFNPLPDWSTYAVLTIWESEDDANQFIHNSELFDSYRAHSEHTFTLYMNNIRAQGLWSGKNPFIAIDKKPNEGDKICVITRATIKKRFLHKFWKYVPTSHQKLNDNPDLIFTKGIGEIPIIQMATFSVWNNLDAIKNFAYKSKEHNTAVKMTRKLGWYKEELFARFVIVKWEGSWDSFDLKML